MDCTGGTEQTRRSTPVELPSKGNASVITEQLRRVSRDWHRGSTASMHDKAYVPSISGRARDSFGAGTLASEGEPARGVDDVTA